ncbi:MAG: hypothetical protein DLM50_06090 [Candidatus Meridianibacter frigidus]|nr:MAG: hypothetical protein DLM50_06090 [Candidatus Eremiobacteraeota bacterium]
MLYFEEALRVLMANKIRTLLTITGLIIGVGAVIAIQVLGSGMSGAVEGLLGGLADNSFFVQPNVQQGDFQKAAMHEKDLADLRIHVANVSDVAPLSFVRQLAHVGHGHSPAVLFAASAERYATTPFAFGGNFTPDQVAARATVCILSYKTYQKLFPDNSDPLGKSLHVANRRYVITGVMAAPRTGVLNANFGGDVAIPYTVYERDWLQGRILFGAAIYVIDQSQMAQTEVAVINELRNLHRNVKGIQYITFDKKTFNQLVGAVFGVLTMIVGLIGAVSLLVAGIGIMNIMLVSVTERTREIGIRKAIGARKGQILAQFFVEALLLCGIGCGIGLALGLAIGYGVNAFAIVKLTGSITALPWLRATLIAVTFATIVTLAFGTYPAYRASNLDPIEALRYE